MTENIKNIPAQCYECDWRKYHRDGWFCNHPASDKKIQTRHPYYRLKNCPLIKESKNENQA